ncbi:MAG: hypothetical protein H3Z52_03040 [archaeon]|nr:hypothetical protein [archaeon]MCP8319903.1 hypothetical protein [archaeon]
MSFLRKLKEKVTPPKANVSLNLSKNTFALGEDLEGTLVLNSEEEFDASEVRVEFRCIERKKEKRYEWNEQTRRGEWKEFWETATLYSTDLKVSEELHLTQGYKKEFSFRINIPASGRESYRSVDGSVIWSVKGVLAIKGRPDATSKTVEVQVIKQLAPTVVKEIVREVVMIPCAYCGKLMPQTSTLCPYCGAPRRA